jgi:hypothetical protein
MRVLWIRIGFNADPDLAAYLNEDPDADPRSQTNADASRSESWSDFASLKVKFLHETYNYVGGKRS